MKKQKITKTKAAKREGGGGKLSRSEIVQVRLDPKLRFAAELASRKQRRTLSSFIEWCIQQTLDEFSFGKSETGFPDQGFNAINQIWDVDEADRFAKLALAYPNFLNHEEEILWKLICETKSVWITSINKDGKEIWYIRPNKIRFRELRKLWETFKKIAKGDLSLSAIPDLAHLDTDVISSQWR